MFLNVLIILLTLLIIIYTYFKQSYNYWKNRNVPYPEPTIPFGNPPKRNQHMAMHTLDIYKQMKLQGHKHAGIYLLNIPIYLPIDINLIKNILIRDFSHFVNRGVYSNEEKDPMSAHLIALEDEKWHNLRAKLSPSFTTGRIKAMLDTIVKCGEPFIEEIGKQSDCIDIKEFTSKYMVDVIGSCAFGIDCNSFKSVENKFREHSNAFDSGFWIFFFSVFPNVCKWLGLRAINKSTSDYFGGIVKSTVEYREKNNCSRNDFIQQLINMKNGDSDTKLSMNEVMAQAFVFFLAGFESSSSSLAYCFYELAKNLKVQQKLRKEIIAGIKEHNGDVSYDAISEMKYLECVIKETLRKYPTLPILNRVCNKDYKVEGTDVTITEGTKCFIPVYAINHDPDIYPDPEAFNPDRFSSNTVPLLTFGDGPRICIGSRFAMMQMKVCIINTLRNYTLMLNKMTPNKLNVAHNTFTLTSKETIYLVAKRI